MLQYVVLATAWNILGGYCGYVNFGSAAFFALGAYSAVAMHKLHPLPIPVLVIIGGVVSGVVGLGMGYLTLRLRGAFFAIATLALAVVLQTLIVNWDFVGGSRGAYIVRPEAIVLFGILLFRYLFLIMMLLAVGAITVARGDRALAARLRLRHHSRRRTGGRSLRRADVAAQADRDHDLRRADGHGGRTVSLLHRLSAADLRVRSRLRRQFDSHAADRRHDELGGPLIGAMLLGSLQQIATVTISSAVNLLIVGFLLVGFVIVAPNGIIGLAHKFLQHRPAGRVGRRVEADASEQLP